jgi:flagellar export protein FliJ
MPYSFRLQSVLDFRKSMVARLQLELATLEAHAVEEQTRLQALRDGEQNVLQTLSTARERGLDGMHIRQSAELLETLQTELAQRLLILHRLRSEADDLRRKLEASLSRSKALENLRDRQIDEHRVDEQRQERAVTGEIALTQLRRQQATV